MKKFLQKKIRVTIILLIVNLFFIGQSFGQITQKGSATTATSTTTSITINNPTGVQSGDLLIANICQSDNDSKTLSNASRSGWTLIDGRLIYDAGANSFWGTILYRIADGTEGANFSFTLDGDANESNVGAIVAYSGVSVFGGVTATGAAGGPFDVDPGTINAPNTNSSSVTATGLTTASAGAMIIMFTQSADNITFSNYNTTNPGALTELYENSFNSIVDLAIGAASRIKNTTGATGNGTASLSGNTRSGGLLVALKPCVPPTITGTLTACAGSTTQLDGSGTAATSNPWVSSTTGVATVNSSGLVTALSGGSSLITYTNNLGCSVTATVIVTGNATANAGTAINTCSNSGAVNITAGAGATSQSLVTWTSSGTGTFANSNSLTTASYTASAADITSGSVILTLTATASSPCTAEAVSSKLLTINTPPTADAGTAISTCSNAGSINITTGASATNQVSILWSTSNGTGTFANSNSITTATYNPGAADASAGTRTLILTAVAQPGCVNATDSKIISVTAAATAVAGNPVSTCSNSGEVNITAGASSLNNSGISWSTSNGTGTFSNENSLTTATYTPSAADITAGSVTIVLTASPNTPCASDATSSKILTINNPPTATAGTAILTCSNSGAVNITAGASVTNQSGITWTTSDGSGTFSNTTSLTLATYNPSGADNLAGSRTLVLTATGLAGCGNATDSKLVNITSAPTAFAGSSFSTCANSGVINITSGSTVSNEAGVTWSSSGTGTFTNANSLSLATYDPSAADILVGSVVLTLTASGNSPCADAVSNKTLTINPVPVLTGTSVCQGRASNSLGSSSTCIAQSPATSGPNLAGNGSSSGSGTAWSNPGRVNANDNSYTSVNGSGNAFSQSLNATEFGFSIPVDATIKGIEVTIGRFRNGGNFGDIQDNSVRLVKAGIATGNNNGATSTNWPTSEAAANYGNTTDLWGTSWNSAEVNASNFGVALIVDQTIGFGTTRTANVDYVQVSITYTVPGSLNWYTASSGGSSIGTGTTFDPVGVAGSGLPTTAIAGTTTFYAECSTVPGCRSTVDFIINAAPSAPVSGGDQTVCEDGNPSQTLTASATGGTITWYDAATNGNVATPQQVGAGSSTFYAESYDGSCSSLTRTPVTLVITAAPPAPSASSQTVCFNGSPTQTITATATGGIITWYDAATNGNIVASPSQTAVGTSTYYAESFDGSCNSLTRTAVTLTINPAPDAPISGGDQAVCSDGTSTQTLTATATGGIITWYDALTNGNIVTPTQVAVGVSTYYAESSDGNCSSLTRTAVTLTIRPLPVTPFLSVTQPNCISPTGIISVTSPTGAGFLYDIGSGFQSATDFTGVAAGTYYLSVQDNFGCISELPAVATVNPQPFVPAAPIVDGVNNVCPYLGTNDLISYSAEATGADSYNWVLPPNVVLESGGGTNSIEVRFLSGFGAQANKQIRVAAVSACGVSTQSIYYLVAQFPSTPPPISGPTQICDLIGSANTATYVINKVAAATSYVWTTPAATASVTHPGGPGINDTIIVVSFAAGYSSGSITVAAVNGCGTSGSVRSLFIPRTSASKPGLITGPTNVCSNILPDGNEAVYSIESIPGVISYNWTVPVNAIVTHPNGTGPNDYTINVQFPVGFTNGSISVSATNGCGTGASRSLAISRLKPATPSVIDIIQLQPCPGRQYSYTLSSVPANASSLLWTIPLSAGAVLLDETEKSIVVSYPATATQGNITVQSINNCGSSTIRSIEVKLPACPPEDFTKQNQKNRSFDEILPETLNKMEVKLFPNPTASNFNLKIISAEKETVHVRIIDIEGRELKVITVMPYQTINLGNELAKGTYFIEVVQATNKIIQRMVKF